MSTETESFPAGTLVRVTEDHQLDGEHLVKKGTEFVVDMCVGAAEADDGIAFCYGDDAGWTTRYAAPDKVKLVKTVEQMYARRIPTAEEIIAELDCLDDYGDFRIDAAESPDGNSREISGRTKDGLFFACTITVSNVYQGDF